MPDGSRSSLVEVVTDPESLASLYREHAPYVWRVLRHVGVPDADLDDAVQETFLVVFRRLHEFEGRASLRTWLYAVAVRVAATRRRTHERERRRRDRAGATVHGTTDDDPEAALYRAEAADLVDTLLTDLDPPKRTVFVLAELEGVRVPEISKILGVNPRTVHSRLRLARESFSASLRRVRAREEGNQRLARLKPRALLAAATDNPAPAQRRKVACAAVLAQIEAGALPTLPGWQTITLSSGIAWTGPIAAVAAGLAGLALWAGGTSHDDKTSDAPAPPEVAAAAEGPTTPSSTPATNGVEVAESPTPAPTPETVQATPPSPRPAPKRAVASKTRAGDPLAAETKLLADARGRLRDGQPGRALDALATYERKFPDGELRDEMRATKLRALCAAGQPETAVAYADRLAPGATDDKWHTILHAACSVNE